MIADLHPIFKTDTNYPRLKGRNSHSTTMYSLHFAKFNFHSKTSLVFVNKPIANLTNLNEHFTNNNYFYYFSKSNIIVSKGLILDSNTLEVLVFVHIKQRYRCFGENWSAITYYRNSSLVIYVATELNVKVVEKLLPLSQFIKIIFLPKEDLQRLVYEEHE
jgi:hypothetical protein